MNHSRTIFKRPCLGWIVLALLGFNSLTFSQQPSPDEAPKGASEFARLLAEGSEDPRLLALAEELFEDAPGRAESDLRNVFADLSPGQQRLIAHVLGQLGQQVSTFIVLTGVATTGDATIRHWLVTAAQSMSQRFCDDSSWSLVVGNEVMLCPEEACLLGVRLIASAGGKAGQRLLNDLLTSTDRKLLSVALQLLPPSVISDQQISHLAALIKDNGESTELRNLAIKVLSSCGVRARTDLKAMAQASTGSPSSRPFPAPVQAHLRRSVQQFNTPRGARPPVNATPADREVRVEEPAAASSFQNGILVCLFLALFATAAGVSANLKAISILYPPAFILFVIALLVSLGSGRAAGESWLLLGVTGGVLCSDVLLLLRIHPKWKKAPSPSGRRKSAHSSAEATRRVDRAKLEGTICHVAHILESNCLKADGGVSTLVTPERGFEEFDRVIRARRMEWPNRRVSGTPNMSQSIPDAEARVPDQTGSAESKPGPMDRGRWSPIFHEVDKDSSELHDLYPHELEPAWQSGAHRRPPAQATRKLVRFRPGNQGSESGAHQRPPAQATRKLVRFLSGESGAHQRPPAHATQKLARSLLGGSGAHQRPPGHATQKLARFLPGDQGTASGTPQRPPTEATRVTKLVDPEPKERRSDPRGADRRKVWYKVLSSPRMELRGICGQAELIDISKSGFSFSDPIDIGVSSVLAIVLEEFDGCIFRAQVKVCSSTVIQEGAFKIGVRLVTPDLTPDPKQLYAQIKKVQSALIDKNLKLSKQTL